jgi:hypothetical protein
MRDVPVPKVSYILLIFAFAVSSFYLIATASAVSESEATSVANDADKAVTAAYIAVLNAEEAGANVSSLLVQLDEAGGFLSRAQMAYRSGDFDEAFSFANLAKNIGEEVRDEADGAKIVASAESQQRLWFAVTGSVVGTVLIAVGSFLGWRIFKRRYCERVLKMKPEVVSYGS